MVIKNLFYVELLSHLQLDAFACPKLKIEHGKVADRLKYTLLQLDEAKSTCCELQEKLREKDVYYMQSLKEQQLLHRHELEKGIFSK